MLSQHYIDMTSQKSAIRELFDYGSRRAKEIGYENVFDYSLGNPSVPTPQAFSDALVDLIQMRSLRLPRFFRNTIIM